MSSTPLQPTRPAANVVLDARGRPYVSTLGPTLRALLFFLFACVAVLGATGAYLAAITFLNWTVSDPSRKFETVFWLWMLTLHCAIGILFVLPFLAFGTTHLVTARTRPNRKAVRLGIGLFIVGILVVLSGLALFQLEGFPQLQSGTMARRITYWAHIVLPVLAVYVYVLHRQAGPLIRWHLAKYWATGVGVFVAVMVSLHFVDPRGYFQKGPAEGVQYFFPSEARTATGKFIPAEALMMDEYCMKCHADIYNDHLHSAHKFSSFNNPPYLFSVRETRAYALDRDKNVKASRWCAGCHDVVPFFSGAFDDPNFDDEKHPTAHAGITCVACHAITNLHSTIGNAAYTIEEPEQYPFAYSRNAALQWINNQLVKAKPDLHKKTFLKPLHKSAEFCSTCHKVHLPAALNHYKDFLRGQNHYDTFILSGMGNGSRSFYYPPKAQPNCADCHMPFTPSPTDPVARDRDGSGIRTVRSHAFPGANTGLPFLLEQDERFAKLTPGFEKAIQMHTDFLKGTDPGGKDKKLRIDLFGVKKFKPDGTVDDDSLSVLRPNLPKLVPGQTYLVEVVVRTLFIGHPFSQGTVDSNEIWVDFQAKAGGKVIGRNGALSNRDDSGPVDEWAHFINVLMLDKDGNRINRRNPQNIFTPLYDHQIPPGAGQVVHYKLEVPKDVAGPVELTVKVRYRKFDYEYMKLVHDKLKLPVPKLPIVDICEDHVILPVEGVAGELPEKQESPIKAGWQRWNDYGIGCLIEGGAGAKRGNLRQAEVAFQKLLTLGAKDAVWNGHVNLARVYIEQGRLQEAAHELNEARTCDPPAPWWLLAWFSGLVTIENANSAADVDTAIVQFETIVDPAKQPKDRNFNFTKDYVVLDKLGATLFKRSQYETDKPAEQRKFLLKAISAYERALAVDSEDIDAHYGLNQCYGQLGTDAPETATDDPSPVTPERLLSLGASVANVKEPAEQRIQQAAKLGGALVAFGRQAPDPKVMKLAALRDLLAVVRPAYEVEKNEAVQAALAAVLRHLHLAFHTIFKPDDLARSRTTALYRAKNPAANAAAEAIVIYPTNRKDAPGLDR
jgi:tetratricopeptide (TPR) repeat protein